jgi:hypothetical protein
MEKQGRIPLPLSDDDDGSATYAADAAEWCYARGLDGAGSVWTGEAALRMMA